MAPYCHLKVLQLCLLFPLLTARWHHRHELYVLLTYQRDKVGLLPCECLYLFPTSYDPFLLYLPRPSHDYAFVHPNPTNPQLPCFYTIHKETLLPFSFHRSNQFLNSLSWILIFLACPKCLLHLGHIYVVTKRKPVSDG